MNIGSETGRYGSIWADIHTGWISRALGSLWDASQAFNQPEKSNIVFCFSQHLPVVCSIFLKFPSLYRGKLV